MQILIYTRSALEDVNLSGNCLTNGGVVTVLSGASVAKNLKKLALADNQFSCAIDEPEKEPPAVFKKLEGCMRKNKKLAKYDFKHNAFNDDGLKRLTEYLTQEDMKHVNDIEVPERVEDKLVMEEFKKALAANKSSGKKKGKKKSGKKKKK